MQLSTEQLKTLASLADRWLVASPHERDVLFADAAIHGTDFARAFSVMISQLDADNSATLLPAISDGVRNAALSDTKTASASASALDKAPPQRQSGQHVGPYRLIKEIGRGGMGVVWLAARADGQHERQVALKMPLVENLNWLLAARFARERNILASLEHPGIARLYDAGVDSETQPYIALEYVVGVPINDYVRNNALKPEATVALFTKVISAVSHAHAQLVIHRDIKPTNILVDGKGEPHLLDFGIAKLLDDEDAMSAEATQLTRLSGRALTLDYASPEQVIGQTLGTASDVYALGVVLYELLTGNKPYAPTGPTRRDLELAICEQEPAKPSDRLMLTGTSEAGKTARRIRGDLDTVVLKALKKDPRQRYATAQAFADDLKRYLAFEPITAKPDSEWYRITKFARRNRWAMVAVGAVATAVAVGVMSTLWQTQRAEREAARANAEATKSAEQAKRAQASALDARTQAALAAREATRADAEARGAGLERDAAAQSALDANLANTRAQVASSRANRERDRASTKEALATTEAKRANAVSDYLTEVFLTNSINQQDSEAAQKTTALELLHRGTETVSQRLRDDPVALSKMLETFGLLFHNFGQYAKAITISKENLDVRMANSFTPPERLRAATALAALYIATNNYDEMALVFDRMKADELRVPQADLATLGPYYSVLGQFKRRRALPDATETLEKAHQKLITLAASNDATLADVPTLMVTAGYVSFSYADRGEFDRALALIDKTLAAAQPFKTKYWAYFGRLLSERGHVLRLAARFLEADRTIVAAQNIYVENGYPKHPNISVMDSFRVEGLARTGNLVLFNNVVERGLLQEQKADPNSNVYWQSMFIATSFRAALGQESACADVEKILGAVKNRPMYAALMRSRMWPLITFCIDGKRSDEARRFAAGWLGETRKTSVGAPSRTDPGVDMQRENALAAVDNSDGRYAAAQARMIKFVSTIPPVTERRQLLNWLELLPTFCRVENALANNEMCMKQLSAALSLLDSDSELAAWLPIRAQLQFWLATGMVGRAQFSEARKLAVDALRIQQASELADSVNTQLTVALIADIDRANK